MLIENIIHCFFKPLSASGIRPLLGFTPTVTIVLQCAGILTKSLLTDTAII
jgi:hypothetical protein